jgi:hypothetical protein
MKKAVSLLIITIITFATFLLFSCSQTSEKGKFHSAISIPVKGNTWVTDTIMEKGKMISDSGITGWTNTRSILQTYFSLERTGTISVATRARVKSGKSTIECSYGDASRIISLSNKSFDTINIGTFTVTKPGYQSIKLKGLKRSGISFAEITDFLITGEATTGKNYFVKQDFYWGRRGPSVHLRYDIPKKAKDIKWFYNEITVPVGNDVLGSYFMADGFTDGYFGIQVNGPDERRILFSVWSPFKTDNPKEIPEDFRIKMLKKGEGVHSGEFGSEGSGGQSYKKFMWKAGTTYGFLLKGEPSANNSTDYTAFFFSPESGKWELIASFRRPKGSRYLGNLYSFLENFWTETGYITRRGLYSNQWVVTKDGKWFELTGVKFTADATAKKESRLDYSGGVENGAFFLKNCGFFNEKTEINSMFSRESTRKHPDLNFKDLLEERRGDMGR